MNCSNQKTPPQLTVVLEGGLVSTVVSTNPEYEGIEVTIIDYDIGDSDVDQLTVIYQDGGRYVYAIVGSTYIEKNKVQIKEQ